MVHDTNRTEKTATATFTAQMRRNENAPRFSQSEYRVTINDRYNLGQEVIQVTATDTDEVRFLSSLKCKKLKERDNWIQ